MLLDIQVVGVGGDSLECFLGIFLITLLLRCACTTLEASNRETDWRENQTQTWPALRISSPSPLRWQRLTASKNK